MSLVSLVSFLLGAVLGLLFVVVVVDVVLFAVVLSGALPDAVRAEIGQEGVTGQKQQHANHAAAEGFEEVFIS